MPWKPDHKLCKNGHSALPLQLFTVHNQYTMEAKVMSRYDPRTAKKIYLYRNGAINTDPKQLVVNDRQVRDFGTFLNRVTSGLRAPVAIRNIYTPSEGHKIRTLDDLQTGHYYVAGGAEHFKKARYGTGPKLLQRRPTRVEVSIPARTHQAVVASARYKRPVEKPFVIHVFRNGDERFKGVRVLLPRRIMGSWEHVLEVITEKTELFTPAKRLCTLDGRTVHAVSELQDGSKYVAVEGTRPFKKVAYCATVETHTSPLHKRRLYTIPRIRRRVKKLRHQAASQPPEDSSGIGDKPYRPPPEVLLQRRKSRPMAGRKNKEAREQAIIDHRADSVFGGSPTQQMLGGRMPSPPRASQLHVSTHQPRDLTRKPYGSTHGLQDPTHKPQNSIPKSQDLDASMEEPAMVTAVTTTAMASPVPAEEPMTRPEGRRERRGAVVPVEEPTRGPEGRRERRDSASRKESTGDESSTSSRHSRARGVFQAPSQPAMAAQPQSEYVEDTQGEAVFTAKLQRSETQDAEDVQESRDIEVEQPVDQEEAREVEEEEGEGPGAEPQEPTSHQTEKQSSQDLELESQPLQTSVDLSMNRVQPTAASTASHSPSEHGPASRTEGEGGSGAGGTVLTEVAQLRAGLSEGAETSIPEEGERGSPGSVSSGGAHPKEGGEEIREELAEEPIPEEEVEPVPEDVGPVPEEEVEPVPEEDMGPVPEEEVEPVPEDVGPVPEEEVEPVPEDVDPVPVEEVESVPEEEEEPIPVGEREPSQHGSQASRQPAASKTTSRQESQDKAAEDPQPVEEEIAEETHSQHSGQSASRAGSSGQVQGEELGEGSGSRVSPEQTFVVEDS